jgi:hypothetical protein
VIALRLQDYTTADELFRAIKKLNLADHVQSTLQHHETSESYPYLGRAKHASTDKLIMVSKNLLRLGASRERLIMRVLGLYKQFPEVAQPVLGMLCLLFTQPRQFIATFIHIFAFAWSKKTFFSRAFKGRQMNTLSQPSLRSTLH